MKYPELLVGLLQTLAHTKDKGKPSKMSLCEAGYTQLLGEIRDVIEHAMKDGDEEFCQQFHPVMYQGKLRPAIMGVPIMIDESLKELAEHVSNALKPDTTIDQPSMN